MRAVVQRVNFARLEIEGKVFSEIEKGLLVFVGVGNDDNEDDVDYIVKKISKIRIFEKDEKMNLDVKDIGGKIMIVSQFTLYGDMRGGNRPSFTSSAKGDFARLLYEKVIEKTVENGIQVVTGVFGAHMNINFENDGPVTIMLDSGRSF